MKIPEHRFHNSFCRPGKKSRATIKNVFFRRKSCGVQFLFFVFLRVRRGRRGAQVRRGAQGGAEGADEASPRGRGGPMLRGFVDALDR